MSSIRERFDWYSLLRSAQRAVSVVRPLHGEAPAETALWEIRAQLSELGPDPEPDDDPDTNKAEREAALQELDNRLAAVTAELRGIAAETPMAEFRAALPAIHESRPQEAAGLLDLCIGDPEHIEPVASLIEYLATLLATERTPAGPELVSDPAEATPRVAEVCTAIERRFDAEDIEPHVRALRDVSAEIPRAESIEPLIVRMQQYKARLGLVRFTPEVLRAVVRYNVAVACRLHTDLESERHLAQCETPMALELLAWETDEDVEREVDAAPERPADDTAERCALRTVVAALGPWLRRERLDSSPEAAVAAALNLSRMSQAERRLFTEPEEEAGRDLLRETIALGLILGSGDEVKEPARALGLNTDRLRAKTVGTLEAELQQATSGCMADNRYDDAKLFSRIRTRYLSHEGDAGATSSMDASIEGPAPEPQLAEMPAPQAATRRPERAPRASERSEAASPSRRPALLLAAVLACLALAGVGYIQRDVRTVRGLTADQVGVLSPYLESARRDGHGSGPSFFGVVNTQWNALTRQEQREHTRELAAELSAEGVREVMLFDARDRLRGHYADGRVVHPKRR